MRTLTFTFEGAIVSCRRIVCNPCACDEYEVVIRTTNGLEYTETTLASPFEWDEDICRRVYAEWSKNN